jgi:hypothetical protein
MTTPSLMDQRMICTAFEALQSLRHKMRATGTFVSKETLTNTMLQMIQTGTLIGIRHLCELESARTLFTPSAAGVVLQPTWMVLLVPGSI